MPVSTQVMTSVDDSQQRHSPTISEDNCSVAELQQSNEKENEMVPKTKLDADIKDLFAAYNIYSDDLTKIYEDTEKAVIEREQFLCSQVVLESDSTSTMQLVKEYLPTVTPQPNGLSSHINFPWSENGTKQVDLWSALNASSDKVANLDIGEALNALKSSSSFLPCSGSVFNAQSFLQKIAVGEMCSSNLTQGDQKFELPTSDVMEKSLFVNLGFKPGYSASFWEKFVPFESDKVNGDQLERCVDCGAAYTTSSALFYHFRRKSQISKQFQCKKCVLPINNECAAKAHQRLHFLTGPYVCFICGLRCANEIRLLHHIDSHGIECKIQNNIACHSCQLVFISKEHLIKHRDAAHKMKQLQTTSSTGVSMSVTQVVPQLTTSSAMNPAIESIVNGSKRMTFSVAKAVRDNQVPPLKPATSVKIVPPPPPKLNSESEINSTSTTKLTPMVNSVDQTKKEKAVGNGATGSSTTALGTKCHLCQKVLSRRDKLKWHLAICCPRFSVDLYDQLIVAGFAHAIAKNVVLGSNCAAKCQHCNTRLSSRTALEQHENTCTLRVLGASDSVIGALTGQQSNNSGVGTESTSTAVNGSSSSSSRGSANLSSSSSTAVAATGNHHQQQQSASSSSPIDRLTCHLCNRTLSRRDKLKRHIVRCCETHKRDVEIALLVAGFTAKDVEKVLAASGNGNLPRNRANLSTNEVPTAEIRPPIEPQLPIMTETETTDNHFLETDNHDIEATSNASLLQSQESSMKDSEGESGFFELETQKPIQYHQSSENIPQPPSFPADISCLQLEPSFKQSSSNPETSKGRGTMTSSSFGATKANLNDSGSRSPLELAEESSGVICWEPIKNNPTTLTTLLEVSRNTPSNSNYLKQVGDSERICNDVRLNRDADIEEVEIDEMIATVDAEGRPQVKRSKFKCEDCGQVFGCKSTFSKHCCIKSN